MQSSSSRPSSSSIVNGATPPPASAPRLAGPPAGSFGYPPLGASSSGVLAQQVFSGYHHNHQSTTSNPPSASSECIARLKATQAAKAPAAAVVAGVSAAYYGAAVRAVQPVALSFSPALPASGADSARDPTSLSSRASLMDSLADVRRRLGELGATPEYCDNYFRGRVGTCECVEDVCVRHKRGLPPPPEGFIDQEKSVKEIAENRATYNFVCGRITANRDKLKRVVNLLRVVSDQLKVDGFFSEEAGAASTSLESAGTAAADAAAASLPCSTSVEGLSEALDVAPPVSTSPSSKIQDQKRSLETLRSELDRSLMHDNGILFHLCQQRRDVLKLVPLDLKVFHENMVRLLQEESVLLEKLFFGRCVKPKTASSSSPSAAAAGGLASEPGAVAGASRASQPQP